jgi:hypothetical protein
VPDPNFRFSMCYAKLRRFRFRSTRKSYRYGTSTSETGGNRKSTGVVVTFNVRITSSLHHRTNLRSGVVLGVKEVVPSLGTIIVVMNPHPRSSEVQRYRLSGGPSISLILAYCFRGAKRLARKPRAGTATAATPPPKGHNQPVGTCRQHLPCRHCVRTGRAGNNFHWTRWPGAGRFPASGRPDPSARSCAAWNSREGLSPLPNLPRRPVDRVLGHLGVRRHAAPAAVEVLARGTFRHRVCRVLYHLMVRPRVERDLFGAHDWKDFGLQIGRAPANPGPNSSRNSSQSTHYSAQRSPM